MDITDKITQWPTDSCQLHLFLRRLSGKPQIQHLLAPHVSRINWVVVACIFFFLSLFQREIKKPLLSLCMLFLLKTALVLYLLLAKECITLVEGWCHLHCPSLSCEAICWYLGKGCSCARGSDASCSAAGKWDLPPGWSWGCSVGLCHEMGEQILFLFYIFYILTIPKFVFTSVVPERQLLLLPNLM